MTVYQRTQGRAADALRPVRITRHYTRTPRARCWPLPLATPSPVHRPRSRIASAAAPARLRCRLVTAEAGMLPRSTHTRTDPRGGAGKQSGRTQEIQRLIGRSLRCVFDRPARRARRSIESTAT